MENIILQTPPKAPIQSKTIEPESKTQRSIQQQIMWMMRRIKSRRTPVIMKCVNLLHQITLESRRHSNTQNDSRFATTESGTV
ncbi:hypothetical protein QN277_011847 [Acacia crassicarpa]|uniref:Uncharacterized protein n=1 Tax=Acacia crassicarpa TaxID=499986 RepID=A0AAE1MZP1_9FABA|nr:hypothetical protein QN277_011847 [Acacia crassicarpa]